MNPKQLLQAIQEEFEALIAAKNSWGKNELMLLMEKAKTNALLRFL
jgi:hypothetical protein